jgi:hypothetical protein
MTDCQRKTFKQEVAVEVQLEADPRRIGEVSLLPKGKKLMQVSSNPARFNTPSSTGHLCAVDYFQPDNNVIFAKLLEAWNGHIGDKH